MHLRCYFRLGIGFRKFFRVLCGKKIGFYIFARIRRKREKRPFLRFSSNPRKKFKNFFWAQIDIFSHQKYFYAYKKPFSVRQDRLKFLNPKKNIFSHLKYMWYQIDWKSREKRFQVPCTKSTEIVPKVFLCISGAILGLEQVLEKFSEYFAEKKLDFTFLHEYAENEKKGLFYDFRRIHVKNSKIFFGPKSTYFRTKSIFMRIKSHFLSDRIV